MAGFEWQHDVLRTLEGTRPAPASAPPPVRPSAVSGPPAASPPPPPSPRERPAVPASVADPQGPQGGQGAGAPPPRRPSGRPPWLTAPAPPAPAEPPPDPGPLPPVRDLTRRVRDGDPLIRRVRRAAGRGLGADRRAGADVVLAERIQRPVTTGRRIAVAGVRGGAGKSTVTALLGAAFARYRQDRVLVVDGDPDMGSLSTRLGTEPATSLHDLVTRHGAPRGFDDLVPHLRHAPSGLWVLSGRRDATTGAPFDATSFRVAQPVLSRFFAVSVVDCGAGLYHELTRTVLTRVHSLVLVSPATPDGVRSTRAVLDQLAGTGYLPLLQRCLVALVSHASERATDLTAAERALTVHGVAVERMPYDRHLAAGTTLDLGRVGDDTRVFTMRTAAEILLRASWS